MTAKHMKTVSDSDLDSLRDRTGIDAPEGEALGPEFWAGAKLVQPIGKSHISLRMDRDVLAWFKAQGRGYQTRINSVLRTYMRAAAKGPGRSGKSVTRSRRHG